MSRRQLQEDTELINKIAFGGGGGVKTAQSRFNSTEYEARLLWQSFYALLKLDSSTGALYLDPMQSGDDQQTAYSRLARLIEFYYFEQGLASKRLRVTALDENQGVDMAIFVDLVFSPVRTANSTSNGLG